ncbi:Methylated-DNA--protein-cysteine methyltransferase [Sedimentisphaera cyanobacteriorum]|uniref:Methylated-DNA--protein-cysteine methyltransferase n=1 Tax=Sedimentisphaera cyanobacteriorum TaxID=1940790 RepID=A0A1Q2HNC6_9BACT|nr:methylated-DNA--[protein]-cysteine S-methyltransferase [Sedimentisphaera cyanobacteriorum]AQQ08755.1 Methylated-DNA--protein-cysteine methyltransferase [Sedimentisphaera cyanobacteriorum]
MQKKPKHQFEHQIFRTEFGWAGIVESAGIVLRVILPAESREKILSEVKQYKSFPKAPDYKAGEIIHYFQGRQADFSGLKIQLDESRFSEEILMTAAKLNLGQTVSYSQLAEMAGHKGKARAAGRALASNPIPVIIPCHRVISKDGSPGGFMAGSDNSLKLRMLRLEGIDI